MKNIKIKSSFFKNNRDKLSALLKPGSAAVINSNDILPTNADGTMRFKQNNDLYYLTGIEQEQTILLLYPDSTDSQMKEILFIRDYDADVAVWEGDKLTFEEAETISGIKNIKPVSKFYEIFNDTVNDAENIYLNSNEHDRAKIEIKTRDDRFISYCKEKYPLHNYMRLAPVLYMLRQVKSDEEIELLKQACKLTAKGFERLYKFVKPGVMEYEAEAELVHEFIRSGYNLADYQPIIAAGKNSCALHYVKNNSECKNGDVLLIDAAAGCGPYNADMTRTIPVNGKFSPRQREIYDAVLRAFKGTVKEIKPGKTLKEIALVTRELLAKELLKLKLVEKSDVKDLKHKSPKFKQYYPHDVSHFLGLDVHDVGYFSEPLKPGMVITCEPGIYIAEEGIGVRIENDILITDSGNIDLMKGELIEAEEIEILMNSGK
jgi:Xaa-Pro aminopeptidase